MDQDVLLSPIRLADIERLIENSVKRAIKDINPPPQPEPQEGNINFAVSVIKTMSKSRIYKLTMENSIPHKKRGGRTLWFNRKELEQWLEDGMPNFGEQQTTKRISEVQLK